MLHYHKHQFVACDRTLELYFVGCPYKCSGCQNPELLELTPSNHKDVEPEGIKPELIEYTSIAKQVHILGGEPLAQPHDSLIELCKMLKEMGFKNIVLFTGSDKLPDSAKPIEQYVDFIKFGKFKKELLEYNTNNILGLKLATTNQRVVKISHEE